MTEYAALRKLQAKFRGSLVPGIDEGSVSRIPLVDLVENAEVCRKPCGILPSFLTRAASNSARNLLWVSTGQTNEP